MSITISSHTALDLLYLCGCVVTGVTPSPDRVAAMDLKELYEVSRLHSLTALVCEGLDRSGLLPTEQTLPYRKAFRTALNKSIRKNLMFDTERAKVLDFLEGEGIWYMPLKGVILKDMYPKMGLRQMSDNDILFDPAHREQVRDYFLAQGYHLDLCAADGWAHDTYTKPPVYNFEMHVTLFDAEAEESLHRFYRAARTRLVPDRDRKYGYHFTDEDFYIFLVAHALKHAQISGIGIRYLLDVFVYWQAKGQTMDREALAQELETYGLSDFERKSRELSLAVFSDCQSFSPELLPPEQQQFLQTCLSSGTYGTLKQLVEKDIAKQGGKFRYLLHRTFPGPEVLRCYHPIFRHRWLMPVGWVWRGAAVLLAKPEKRRKARQELPAIWNAGRKKT